MKTKTPPQRLTIAGQRFVVVPEEDYSRLAAKADESEPALPEPTEDGNYAADATLAVIVARKILRRRRALGLTQAELARRANIRPETLNRIEQGKHKPSVPTIDKLDRALKKAEREEKGNA